MVDYNPVSSQVQTIYGLLKDDTAFDKSPLTNTNTVTTHFSSIATLLPTIPGVGSSYSTQLNTFAGGTMSDFSDHLDTQYTDLVKNLGLATGYISDSLAFGITSNPMLFALHRPDNYFLFSATVSDPCSPMSSFFGSITGAANSAMSNLLSPLSSVVSQVSGMTGGSIIGALNAAITAGGSGAPSSAVVSALGGLTSNSALVSLLSTLTTPTQISQLGTVLSNIGGLSSSNLGSVAALVGTPTNILNIGNSLLKFATAITNSSDPSQVTTSLATFANGLTASTTSANALGALSGGLPSLLGNLPGGIGGSLQTLMSGNIGTAMTGVSGLVSSLSTMINNEKNALTSAVSTLTTMAGSINMPLLNGNACASGVLSQVASPSLQSALSGDTTPTTPADQNDNSGSGSGNQDGTTAPIPPTNNITGQQTTSNNFNLSGPNSDSYNPSNGVGTIGNVADPNTVSGIGNIGSKATSYTTAIDSDGTVFMTSSVSPLGVSSPEPVAASTAQPTEDQARVLDSMKYFGGA